ncbi:agouti-signaling protein-like [Poeciliopsis prolifica]|uniref:agouti-signaling protein-like n=1 Tax=Poeciliopsis prolifica TaxID=188132 RepID=UPI002413FBBE|nr:agouti-signaling protein-like [Poeciliopsis prolifica]XP_054881720.1 agouti-signaling protein-like [Poeciliopsis prolifica]XP_054881721.1 agouti-signaling protein-like [Poeciliopsis prolifica]XP_054881722.1 agouti-signaling protein-like [Poeciliopsis prolifica]
MRLCGPDAAQSHGGAVRNVSRDVSGVPGAGRLDSVLGSSLLPPCGSPASRCASASQLAARAVEMQAFLPLGCCVIALTQCCLGSAHMIPDDRLSTNRVVASNALSHSLQVDPPPVVIVELNKSTRKKEKGRKQKKNKFARKRPPPPPDCVPLWGSCKAPGNVCCDFCAFCQCRLFKTVCLCRMGNPRC